MSIPYSSMHGGRERCVYNYVSAVFVHVSGLHTGFLDWDGKDVQCMGM